MENKCVGDICINGGEWYVLTNNLGKENRYTATYCGYCIDNGCVQIEGFYKVDEKLTNCNCDCPDKEMYKLKDKVLKVYLCDKHKKDTGFFTCDMGRCFNCNKQTFSGMVECCDGCSALLKICPYCKIG